MFSEANVTVLVSNMDRSIKFYCETLGMQLLANYGGHFAEIQAKGVKIGLHPGRKPAPPVSLPAPLSIGMRVDDLDKAMETLKSRGVTFQPTATDKGSRHAYFYDPDGTPLYIIEIKHGG